MRNMVLNIAKGAGEQYREELRGWENEDNSIIWNLTEGY